MIFFLTGFLLSGAVADEVITVNCQNADLEIGCSDGRCYASNAGEFTPMSLAFNDAGSVSACAYAGCFDGQGDVQGDERYLSIIARNLVFSPNVNDTPYQADVVIVWDRLDNVALVKMAGFAQPLTCQILQP